MLTELKIIDYLVGCCIDHALHKCFHKHNKPSFKDCILFGAGISQQIIAKQCNNCGVFIFANTTTKLFFEGDTSRAKFAHDEACL